MLSRSAARSPEPASTAAPPVAASFRTSEPVNANSPPAPGAPAPGAPAPGAPAPPPDAPPAAWPGLTRSKCSPAPPPAGRVVDGGGLPAAVCARATLESCGATQIAAPAASPALAVARAKFRRETWPARSSSFPPRLGTLRSIASHALFVKHAYVRYAVLFRCTKNAPIPHVAAKTIASSPRLKW